MNTKTPFSSIRGVFATAVMGAFAFSLAGVCTAAELREPPQTTVKFADLNVSSPAGAAALYNRIRRAALQVCNSIDERNFSSPTHDACVHDAIADAVAKINQPALFTVYNARNGQPTPIVLAAQSR